MIGRRELLGLMAAGVLTRLLITSSAAVPASYMLTDDVYPIGFFWPPPPGETNDFRYAEIAEAGFTSGAYRPVPLNSAIFTCSLPAGAARLYVLIPL